MSKYIDLTGKVFGRLTVIEREKNGENYAVKFLCQCVCGNKTIVHAGNLRKHHTTSCGCLHKEIAKIKNTKHSMCNTAEYKSWAGMKERCNNEKNKRYKSYKGKGITYCKEWESFENFFNDMGRKPTPKHSIDRINNHGNYEPSNCRWASTTTQARNTDNVKLIEFNGDKKCIADWAETTGINAKALYNRLKLGWSVEKALTTPLRIW